MATICNKNPTGLPYRDHQKSGIKPRTGTQVNKQHIERMKYTVVRDSTKITPSRWGWTFKFEGIPFFQNFDIILTKKIYNIINKIHEMLWERKRILQQVFRNEVRCLKYVLLGCKARTTLLRISNTHTHTFCGYTYLRVKMIHTQILFMHHRLL